MDKRKIAIGLVIFAVIIVVIISAFSLGGGKSNVLNSSLTNGYYVGEGAKDYAAGVAVSVESYASQNKNESLESRDTRLAKYFSSDSTVFKQGTEYIRGKITKTVAKVTSVISCGAQDEGDGIYICVLADVKFYSGKDYVSSTQKYLINLFRQSDDKYHPLTIGGMR